MSLVWRYSILGIGSLFAAGVAAREAPAQEVTQTCIRSFEQAGEQRKIFQDYVRARAEALRCSETCPAQLAFECRTWMAQDATKVAHLELSSTLPFASLTVKLDGVVLTTPLSEVNPGIHRVEAVADGYEPLQIELMLAEGQRAKQQLAFVAATPKVVPEKEARELSVPGIIIGSIGLSSLAAAGILAGLGHLEASRLREECAPNCLASDVSLIEREWIASGVLAGVGLAGMIAGGVLVGMSFGEESTTASLQLAPGKAELVLATSF
jgi:hypothetical protein